MKYHQVEVQSKYKRRKINRDATTNLFCRIMPADKSVKKHFDKVREVIKKSSSAQVLVDQLTPVIRG
jgi:hypothetical protein